MRVLLLSSVGLGVNPYLGLLRDGLAAAGADVRLVDRFDPAMLIGPDAPDVIHLHWLDHYDLPPPLAWPAVAAAQDLPRRLLRRGWETLMESRLIYQARRWLRLRRLLGQLAAFRSRGGRVAYTVHNLEPHEGGGLADRWGLAGLVRLADVLHVHDEQTAVALAGRYGRRPGVAVIPHGHYIGCYPNTISRAAARRQLGLPDDAFVYLSLGLLRPYKGLEELIPAFRSLEDTSLRLALAGRPKPEGYGAVLAALAAGDPRIRLDARFVPAEATQVYFNAADLCVLPYRQITTSGAALLALSFGSAVLAPAIGAFPALLAEGRGYLYDPAAPAALARALSDAREVDWSAGRESRLAWVSRFDWPTIGRRLLAAYRA
jgi:glycosyltransferase involved in cell wall biosynthesis